MRDMTIPESGTKRKLLDAAELLFAERGFEAVSVRDITQLAKTNVAAVNYHFGSRDEYLIGNLSVKENVTNDLSGRNRFALPRGSVVR